MKRLSSPKIVLGCVIAALWVGLSPASSQEPPKAPEVNSKQQADGGLQAHQGDDAKAKVADQATPGLLPVGSKSGCGECQPKAEHGEDEGTEFWPPLYGYRLKITDTLVAAFTALLFFATLALWLSTRNLVRGADKTAERQLRAYLVPSGTEIEQIPGGFRMTVALRNTGQTPAFKVRVMSESFGGSYPLEGEHAHAPPRDDYSTIIGSGDEFHCLRRIFSDSPDETLSNVRAGEMGLWIQGWATYDDCFGKPHHTKFRSVFGGPLVSGGELLLHADREGNEAD